MKQTVLILFSLWAGWTQTPPALRPEAEQAGEAVCKCCCTCTHTCDCVSQPARKQQPLPASTTAPSWQTDFSFLTTPASTLTFLHGEPSLLLAISPARFGAPNLPLYRRDCALLL